VNFLKSYTTQAFPDYWLIIMGSLFVAVVLFMPDGIVGVYKQVKSYFARQRSLQTTAA
jgi:urea transport system permease protein